MSKHKWKDQYKDIDSASKFHNKVRDIFATDPYFSRLKCYQEINVVELVPDYPYRNHHFDWYIETLGIVIELHGKQHYEIVNYGNIGYDEAYRSHLRMKDRDNTKKTAAVDAGFEYVEIPYTKEKKLTANVIKELIFYE